MSVLVHQTAAWTALLALFVYTNISMVTAHGYLKQPRSRNYVAYQDKVWHGATENDPFPEDCPQCLNLGGSMAACGITGSHNYSDPRNAFGNDMPINIQGVYSRGQEIDVEVVLTAHHKGHFTFKACPVSMGRVPNQDCFDEFPLEFIQDNLYGSIKDTHYPERAYIPLANYPSLEFDSSGAYGSKYSYRFRLPWEVVGELVLLQWHYVTGNSCKLPGYDQYNWTDGFYDDTDLPPCGELPKDGNGVPEQFWNCAEVRVIDDDSYPTTPPPTGTIATTVPPSSTTSKPTSSTIPNSPTTTEIATTEEPLTPNSNICGKSWEDANIKCVSANSVSCSDGNSTVCPDGEHCYADVSCAKEGSSTSSPWTTVTTAAPGTTTITTSLNGREPVESSSPRCGKSELDAREYCRPTCTSDEDCSAGMSCFAVQSNFCGSIDKPEWVNPSVSKHAFRCGKTEVHARELCGTPCTSGMDCDVEKGEECFAVFKNYCDSETEDMPGRKLRGRRGV